jgi:hypothetical protein
MALAIHSTNALIEKDSNENGNPVSGDVPSRKDAAKKKDAGVRQPESIPYRRVVELEELDGRGECARNYGNGKESQGRQNS